MQLEDSRKRIDELDAQLVELLVERMQTAEQIAAYKQEHQLPVLDTGREQTVIEKVRALAGEDYAEDVEALYVKLMALSRARQESRMPQQQLSFDELLTPSMPEAAAEEPQPQPQKPVYGLIGGKLGQSFSPWLHEQLGSSGYQLMEMTPEQVEEFVTARHFAGVNVTIPYKQTVIPFCDELSDRARRCGAVNTLTVRDGKLYGDNTDYAGFLYLSRFAGIDFSGKTVLVLGSGGTSGTVCAVIKDRGGRPIVVSRSGPVTYHNVAARYAGAQIIVNTTPVGMFPAIAESPLDLMPFTRLIGVLDVVYNPLKTRLLLDAESRGIVCCGGLPMLAAQAKYASDLFLGEQREDALIEPLTQTLYRRLKNVVLCGMPGCGKTTVGRVVAEKLGRELLDTDELIERAEGMSPAEMIRTQGEAAFRAAEKRVIARAAAETNCVIATGGGAVLDAENRLTLRQNGFVVFLKRELSALATEDRPLSADLETLHNDRLPLYKACADITVPNETVEQAAGHILAAFDEVAL